MALPILPDGMRISLEMSLQGKDIANIYHVTTTNVIDDLEMFRIADVFKDWWDVSLSITLSDELSLNAITVTDISVVGGGQIISTVGMPVIGKSINDSITNNVALVASLGTAKTGRSFRGRSFIPGMPVVAITDNHVGLVNAAIVTSAFEDLLAALIVEGARLVVASFISGGVQRLIGVATEIISIAVRTRVDTQRRRLPKESL